MVIRPADTTLNLRGKIRATISELLVVIQLLQTLSLLAGSNSNSKLTISIRTQIIPRFDRVVPLTPISVFTVTDCTISILVRDTPVPTPTLSATHGEMPTVVLPAAWEHPRILSTYNPSEHPNPNRPV
jgi:hypothetical protein